jgi:matrixin
VILRPTPSRWIAGALAVGTTLAVHSGVAAFLNNGRAWPGDAIVMQLQLGDSGALINGCGNWGCSAERALSDWNRFLNRTQFFANRDSGASLVDGNSLNNVFYSDTIYGDRWDANTLAIALTTFIGPRLIEADVLFNGTLNWNAYGGPTRRASSGGLLNDFERVALHEFGHVLGLGHPDEAGQNVPAIMNSIISDIDTLQMDDVRGAYAIYLGQISAASLPFPPRNETLAFRTELEAKYRNSLRRPVGGSFVDPEGSAVWLQEFLQYRMSACRADQATGRVILQILGGGAQPVCGVAPSAPSFPPRNESFSFRQDLEVVYRERLGRMPTPTAVDIEGDVVWITEYLRLRLNRCSHTQATERVLQQIDGVATQPTC